MPGDSSQGIQSRRPSRKLTNEDEIDIRRARGEISCAECRRLKLKCDKKLPCSSCVRRGCPSICPNGSLSTGQGTRFVLADTAQLHTKIAEMGQRIRQLEDALAIFQSGVSNEPHPLLREDLLAIKFGPEKSRVPEKEQRPHPPNIESINAIGTMTLSDGGDTGKYFGPSAGSETLFLAGAEFETSSCDDDAPSTMSVDIAHLSSAFPCGVPCGVDMTADTAFKLLLSYLPEQPRAWSLCETYLEQAAWTFCPVKRDEIINDILAPIYRAVKANESCPVSPHKLGVLYLIFGLGALVDLTIEPYSQEAETYYQLSRACLALRSIFDSPEIATVQAVLLMATYHGMAGKRYTMDSSWTLTSLAAKLAQSIGLHRDSARWNMDAKTVQRRRSLFWEMTSAECFYSLALGRPPSIRLSYVDCELPEDDEATLDENGNTLVGFYRWKYDFCKDILSSVLEQTLTAEAPQYQTILELDRKVREKRLPPHLNVFMSPEEERFTPSVYMRACMLGQFRTVTLLYIHRCWFAQAMLDHPINPLRSPYAPSFLAAYRCASGVIKGNLNHFDRFPELCCRWWGIWTHLFSAAIIVGSIVTRSPSSSMAPSAFIELGLACDLFQKGATHSRRAKSGSAILYKLRQKAFHVYSQFRSGNPPSNNVLTLTKPDYGDDELALFGGQTRVLVSRLLSSKKGKKTFSTATATTPCSGSPTTSSSGEGENLRSPNPLDSSIAEVHPSLVEYLSAFPPPPSNPASPPSQSAENTNTNPTYQNTVNSTPRQQQQDIFSANWGNWQPPPLPPSLPMQDDIPINMVSTPEPYNQPTEYPFTSVPISQPPMNNMLGSDMRTDTPENARLMDLGMMMTGESGMDEQWINFMRESGLMDTTNPSSAQTNANQGFTRSQ